MKLILLLVVLVPYFLFPQGGGKYELRGVWVATVENIDWPSSKNLSAEKQKQELIEILDRLKKLKINSLFFQIRPACDAFYPSQFEPWSEWLTGKQGNPPSPYYDPLEFMITEAHKRGMEFHAWLNPFRSVFNIELNRISSSHVSVRHPDWNVVYGNQKWLNPGIPEVREYINSVVEDIVKRYDVDGIHFDDYFYPYPKKGNQFNDKDSYKKYSRGIKNKEDWRRDNINLLVKEVSNKVKELKPWVKFGISPFGIWRNKSSDVKGSQTSGSQSYETVYADSRKWLSEGWVDYTAPQIYWNIDHAAAGYHKLVEWWNSNAFGKPVYIGMAAYKIGTEDKKNMQWVDPEHFPEEIRLNRSYPNINGNIFFNTNTLLKNPLGLLDSLTNKYYKYYSLVPSSGENEGSGYDRSANKPVNLSWSFEKGKVLLNWNTELPIRNTGESGFFIIYKFVNNKPDIKSNLNVVDVISSTQNYWSDPAEYSASSDVTYAVSFQQRNMNENLEAAMLNIKTMPPIALFSTNSITVKGEIKTDVQTSPITTTKKEDLTPDLSLYNPLKFTIEKEGAYTYKINYPVPWEGFVTLKVFNILGRELYSLVNENKKPGQYDHVLDKGSMKGEYIIQLKSGGYISSYKLKI